ncbi:MAG: FHA domain-containing protein [Saprospiraceae bacterium]|nr:FHA domain-containing protein [Saprospiraceae bacterium]
MIKFTIGRDPDNRYVIFDPNCVISSHHITISQYPDGRLTIQDTSTNGTTLNGARLPKIKK